MFCKSYLVYCFLLLQLTPFLGVNSENCLKNLSGFIEGCNCDVEQVDKFNNYHLRPLLEELLKKDYFRYFRVNLYKICQFWHDDARCTLKDCSVKTCDDEGLPKAFKKYLNHDPFATEYLIDINIKKEKDKDQANCEQSNPLGHLNDTITEENLKTFEEWHNYDDSQDNFCEPDDEYLTKAKYVDLLVNPERYTAYKGEHANKIWSSIYKENCFKEAISNSYADLATANTDTCLEKRVFYRLVSGLHSSINTHLSAKYLHKGILNQPDYWGPNAQEFFRRFDPELTYGNGPQWLKNLYFIYLVELRAIVKASPYLERVIYYTGNSEIDTETKDQVLSVLKKLKSFSCVFDENKLFKGDPVEAVSLKNEFQKKFRNITRIMDCVGCDKCRLWGKLQTHALGTALKILFTTGNKLNNFESGDTKQVFRLSRSEIVALINGFGRLATSIWEIDGFRNMRRIDL